jgi:hypothetical protein
MRTAAVSLDLEVIELLSDVPDLLAVADAIAATHEAPHRRFVAPGAVRLGAVAAIVVVAALLALISPWDGRGGGFVGRALAALGHGRVIHLVSVSEVTGRTVVDLHTGAETPVQTTTEIWFDGRRGLQRTVVRVNGSTSLDELQTPAGAWTGSGRVYTCAWIAAHPLAANTARVSCNSSGVNGAATQIPETRPTLDPALGGFVGGYQAALADGSATRDGSGVVAGRHVEWLKFETEEHPSGEPEQPRFERVAVDAQTLKPILVQTIVEGRRVGSSTIRSVETIDAGAARFTRPRLIPPRESPVATSVTAQEHVAPTAAAAALGGRLVTDGPRLDGLPLSSVTLQRIVTGYGASSGVAPSHSQGVEVLYGGPIDWTSAADYAVLKQSPTPEMLYGYSGPFRNAPAAGSMAVSSSAISTTIAGSTHAVPTGKTIWRGQLRALGVYVSIEATSKQLLLDAARSLTTAVPK